MADQGKGRKLIPSKISRERTIVYIVLVAVVAIVLIVVALAFLTTNSPNNGGANTPSGGGTYPQPTATSNRTAQDLKVDTFTFDQNATSGETTFFVTVTNTGDSSLFRDLNVAVSQTPGVATPNQPYPSRETPTNNVVLTNSTAVTIAPGETVTVPVVVQTPPGFVVNPSNVVITLT